MAGSMLSRRAASVFCVSQLKAFLPAVSQSGGLQQRAGYNPRPLPLNLEGRYIPDKNSEETPEWQKTERYDRRLFARYGRSSGVNPALLWPSPAQLQELSDEEKQWHPPLEEMLRNIAAKEKEKAERKLAREQVIAASMAKMPKMIADWKKGKKEAKLKIKEDKAKRERLLAEARERLGFDIDPRSSKFMEMIAEIEKEEKKKKRLLKKRKKEEEPSASAAASTST